MHISDMSFLHCLINRDTLGRTVEEEIHDLLTLISSAKKTRDFSIVLRLYSSCYGDQADTGFSFFTVPSLLNKKGCHKICETSALLSTFLCGVWWYKSLLLRKDLVHWFTNLGSWVVFITQDWFGEKSWKYISCYRHVECIEPKLLSHNHLISFPELQEDWYINI